MRRKMLLIGMAAMLLLFVLAGLYDEIEVSCYTLSSPKIETPFRIVQISDLHSCSYGNNAQNLLRVIDACHPDLVVLTGDIFDDVLDVQPAQDFVKGIGAKVPCFYVTGNHEYWSKSEAFEYQMKVLEEADVMRLDDQSICVTIQGQPVNLCGINDPTAYNNAVQSEPGAAFREKLASLSEISANGCFTILLSHRPERMEMYARNPFDLVLTGHAHGGQWRIPWILNGVYAPNQGVFPKYVGGLYESNGTRMIVSRGLAKESTPVPRFYNRPEVVVIDVIPD